MRNLTNLLPQGVPWGGLIVGGILGYVIGETMLMWVMELFASPPA
jgi:hypothetical protein